MNQLEIEAKTLSDDFLENEKQYRLGFVESEQANPKTKNLGETFVRNTHDGLKMLFGVDKDLTELFAQTIFSENFDKLQSAILLAIRNKKRVYISGCGSTGRLAMRLEASFRQAIKAASKVNPEALAYENSVFEIMTGGDYAIIRSVESFEDYTELGCTQARDIGVSSGDVFIGVTATGETTSILGSAKQALASGAKVFMVVCSDSNNIIGKLKRVDEVFNHENCSSIYLRCGGMAVTGSTRMQSSSIEQAVIGSALELALDELFGGTDDNETKKHALIQGFGECISLLEAGKSMDVMAAQIDEEADLYSNGGHITYFADEYLLDVLADTTERSPTFATPPFRPQKNKNDTLSWAFVKNPMCDTICAWSTCFEREPRCIHKSAEEYRSIGINEEDIHKIPRISLDALYEFEIGNESDPEREGVNSLATWVGYGDEIPEAFYLQAKKYAKSSLWTIGEADSITVKTRMKLFEHLAMKMMLNAVSTGTMAKMGRVRGNYMVYLNISNKKLVDRATRIISDLCSVDYDTANYELFYSKLLLESQGIEKSAAIETIERLECR